MSSSQLSCGASRGKQGFLAVLSCVLVMLGGCAASASAEDLRVGGTGAALGTMQLLARQFSAQHPDIRVKLVPSLGSSGGIKAVAGGAIDLAVSSRPITEEERQLGAFEFEYGRTPFVFAVAAKSQVAEISLAQLVGIYSGEQVKWPDGSAIRLVLRPASDIDTAMVRGLSTAMRQALSQAEQRPGIRVSVTDQDAADDLERIPGAIGPTSLSLLLSEQRRLKALKLDGQEPSAANLATGAYPYFKRLFLVTGARRAPAADQFIGFVRSPGGRKILAENGHWLP